MHSKSRNEKILLTNSFPVKQVGTAVVMCGAAITTANATGLDQPFNSSCLNSYTIAFSQISLPELTLSIQQTSERVSILESKSNVTTHSAVFSGQAN